ncbi:hypothetical protein [Streptomyces albiflavescens]|uniref:hypothetical protein n=1 Tax=Streptomyces albiflavescens TaxID=1623582 RepID=UPI00166B616C|nr:hypothetical protein [Streptomyces albiflavescens]
MGEGGHPEVGDLSNAGLRGVALGKLVLCTSETDFESFDLAQPAFAFGRGDPGEEVVADFDQPAKRGAG